VADDLLRTKISVPRRRTNAVARPRLVKRLDEVLAARLALISAPAGFGKTTLVTEWITRHGAPVAWYSIDEDDEDEARFLTYLCSALVSVYDGVGTATLNMIRAAEATATRTLFVSLINEITVANTSIVLVLDDYHALDSPEIDEHLTFFLEHTPTDFHVILTSREDPRIPLTQMRALGEVVEIRSRDLRFTGSEAMSFFTEAMGIDLSETHAAILEERTEGWVAGLQMAALTLRSTEQREEFISSFSASHRYIFDYLTEEVLQHQTSAVRRFLIQTSILSTMCGELCDAVVDDAETPGQTTLEELERANLFVVSLDTRRRWYRYHHLFADLLHRRAAVWLLENDSPNEAFAHAAVPTAGVTALQALRDQLPALRRLTRFGVDGDHGSAHCPERANGSYVDTVRLVLAAGGTIRPERGDLTMGSEEVTAILLDPADWSE
jgi:LuxR family maltose regulon positive regulatory protein